MLAAPGQVVASRQRVSARSLLNSLFRRGPKRFIRENIEGMETDRLRALYASDRCRDDPELLVLVWAELCLREKDLQALSEATVHLPGYTRQRIDAG